MSGTIQAAWVWRSDVPIVLWDTVSCEPELGTGYVDGALDEATRAAVEAHLAGCPACREQVDFERALRERLRGFAIPEPRPTLETDVRRRLRPQAPRSVRLLLAIAGTALVAGEWRGVLALALAIIGFHSKATREENILSREFGEDFELYRRETGMLLPRIR